MTKSDGMIGEVESFNYLGSFVQTNKGFVVDLKHKNKCAAGYNGEKCRAFFMIKFQ